MAIQLASASSQYLTTAAAPATDIPVTMSCWFNPAAGSVDGVLMSLNGTSGNFDRVVLTRNSANTIGAQSVSSGVATIANSGTFTSNMWNHAAAVYSLNSKVALLNGVAGTTETSSFSLAGIGQVVIGARRNAGGYGVFYDGAIAEAAIWSTTLTTAEIQSLAKGFTPDQVRPQSLVFYAPLIRDIQDLRGGLAITTVNGPTIAVHPRVIL
jgi:hypothetical protein